MTIPLAAAEPAQVSGTLFTPAGATIWPSASGEVACYGAFWPDASGLRALDVNASRLHVRVFEFERLDTLNLRQSFIDRSRSFDLTDARVSLSGRPAEGSVGYYGEEDGDRASISTERLAIEPTADPIGDSMTPGGGAPDSPFPSYRLAPDHPYVLATGAASFERLGSATLKIHGPTLRIDARENGTTYWTGTRPSETIPGGTTVRWILLTSDVAEVRIASSTPAQVAIGAGDLAVQGSMQVRAAEGILRTANGDYVASGQDGVMTGRFRLGLGLQDADTPSLRMTMDGQMEGTTLSFARAPVPAGSGAPLWVLGIVGLAGIAAVVASATYALKRRTPAYTVEQLVEFAYAAADGGSFGEALDWIERALEIAPGSERLQLDKASFCAELGEVDQALALYDGISKTSSTGEADYHAALLHLKAGNDPAAARERLLRALEKTAHFAFEVGDDPAFAALRRDPVVAHAISVALRKLDEEDRSGPHA